MFTLMLQSKLIRTFLAYLEKNGKIVRTQMKKMVERKKGSVGNRHIFNFALYTYLMSTLVYSSANGAATCCNSLIGCQTYVPTSRPVPAACPKCRSQEGTRHAVRGLHEVVHALRNIVDAD